MSCSSCTRGFSLFTREHGCPGCGFSVCSGCLKATMVVKNKEQKVCNKCFSRAKKPSQQVVVEPPEALQKRMQQQPLPRTLTQTQQPPRTKLSTEDQKLAARLKSLQAERSSLTPSSDQVRERLDKLKDLPASHHSSRPVYEVPDQRTNTERSSDLLGAARAEVELEARTAPALSPEEDIQRRLAKLRGENTDSRPVPRHQKPSLPDPQQFLASNEDVQPDLEKISVEDVNKLMQEVDKKMMLEAEKAMKDLEKDKAIQEQLERLKVKSKKPPAPPGGVEAAEVSEDSEDDQDPTDRILAKILAEAKLEDRLSPLPLDESGEVGGGGEPEELPWCVICNDDAVVRCRDCGGDLYCGGCFTELHSDKYDRKHRTERFRASTKQTVPSY